MRSNTTYGDIGDVCIVFCIIENLGGGSVEGVSVALSAVAAGSYITAGKSKGCSSLVCLLKGGLG